MEGEIELCDQSDGFHRDPITIVITIIKVLVRHASNCSK